MRTLQLTIGALVVALAAAGCSREDADENARRAATGVREAAARAGDQLADGWLTTKIQAQYFADEDIKARYVNVTTRDGVVALEGRVDDEEARRQAVQIARNTDGVRDVQDRLSIGPAESAAEQNDAGWITTQLQARYFADATIQGPDIDIMVNEGVVTLSGRVASEAERQQAVAIAHDVDGVARVEDRLTVEAGAVATTGVQSPGVDAPGDDAAVTSNVQAKLFLDNDLKARQINVATRQGIVTLSGEVASDDERAQALLLARTTAGAERVEDNLTVNPALSPAGPSSAATGAGASGDAALTRDVRTRLSADRQLEAGPLEVTAKDGVVLLEGTVPSAATKQRVLTIVQGTPGVLQVVDRLEVQ